MRALKFICRGFTIVELMITVAIVAILLALAAPEFDRFTAGASLDMTADSFQATLGYARSEALKRGTNVSVRPQTGNWGAGWTAYVDTVPTPSCALVAPTPGQELRIHSVNRTRTTFGITNAGTCAAAAALPCVTYDARGRLIGATGAPITPSLCVSDSKYSTMQRRLSINSEGQYYLEGTKQ
jgi:prepilin-type N-terminal cleavage/methylation domain-containing protein